MNDLTAYSDFFKEVINTINSAKYEAYKSLNKHHIGQNFEIGKLIVKNQEKNNWGKSIVDTLSKDINRILDGTKGYSPQNLWRMRQFYLEYKDKTKLLELALTIPWGQNLLVMHKIKDNQEKEYYLNATDKLGWSRAVLLNQIKANAYQHHILNPKQTNFEKALPVHLSEQANEALKSEYNLDFLGIAKPILERELENRLVEKIRDLILELGYGFSFIGNQYRLKLKQKEYFIDLLFYHRYLRCLVAIDLKIGKFIPEYAGKMNFYLAALNDTIKLSDENPSIGIIICKEKKRTTVEYALKDSNQPIGVATYMLTESLPSELKGLLPTPEEISKRLELLLKEEK